MLIHFGTTYLAYWRWLAEQFTLLGRHHGCVLGILGNAHGPSRWIWVNQWTGRTAPCHIFNQNS